MQTVKVCLYRGNVVRIFDLPDNQEDRQAHLEDLASEGWLDAPGGARQDLGPDYIRFRKPELVAECRQRGLDVPVGARKTDLIGLLEQDDNQ